MALISSLSSLVKRPLKSFAERMFPQASRRNIKLCERAFDKKFYRRAYPASFFLSRSPVRHYLMFGWREGRDPSPSFSTKRYLARYEDVRHSGINPFVHYLRSGRKEGRIADPSDQDEAHSSRKSPAGLEQRSSTGKTNLKMLPRMPLEQQRAFLIEMGYFNEAYYLHMYPDVAKNNIDPFEHYMKEGAREGRNPSPEFDTNYYRATNLDLKAKQNPLLHYAADGGALSGRPCHPHLLDGYPLNQGVRSEERRFFVRTDWDASLDATPAIRLAVHVHCYYFDQFSEILERLKCVPLRFELFVSVTNADNASQCAQIIEQFGWAAHISVVPNRGRDLGPLLVEYAQALAAFDVVLHIHTKKSKERSGEFGAQWRHDLLDKLLFNRAYVTRILRAFVEDQRLGVLAPLPFERIRPFMVWGLNRKIAQELMETALGDASMVGPICPPFPAGGMFWFRPAALRPLLDLKFGYSDFPNEPIGDDGTIAHAIERCLFVVPQHGDWRTGYIEPVPFERCWPAVVKPSVSVIVPVYNAGPWLVPAIQSVLGQESPGTKIELIVVDNGSNDGSLEDLKLFEIFDRPAIKLLTAPQRGAGSARNAGLEAASGDFVMFLDADDLLTTNAVAQLHAAILRTDADVATSSLVMFDEETFSRPMPFSASSDVAVLEPTAYGPAHNDWKQIFADFGPCAKLYRRSFLDDNKIRFPVERNFEDNLFIANIYMKLRKIAVLRQTTYMYRRYKKSRGLTQSTSVSLGAFSDQIWVAKEIIREHGLDSRSRFKRLYLSALVCKLRDELERFPPESRAVDLLLQESELVSMLKSNDAYSELGIGSDRAR